MSSHPIRSTSCFLFALALLGLTAASDAQIRIYGEGAGHGEIVAIADLAADPDAWNGKTVRVQGIVTDVCPMKGCWMELRDADNSSVRVKVEDDVIVFPEDAKGLEAVAHGVVDVQELDRERYVAWMEHLAEEKGETFDPASIGDGPYRIVQIQGKGAAISSPDA